MKKTAQVDLTDKIYVDCFAVGGQEITTMEELERAVAV